MWDGEPSKDAVGEKQTLLSILKNEKTHKHMANFDDKWSITFDFHAEYTVDCIFV